MTEESEHKDAILEKMRIIQNSKNPILRDVGVLLEIQYKFPGTKEDSISLEDLDYYRKHGILPSYNHNEFIKSIDAVIDEVNIYTRRRIWEIPIGVFESKSGVYSDETLELLVTAEDTSCPVKKILYPGVLPLEKGDRVMAYIFNGEVINWDKIHDEERWEQCYPLGSKREVKPKYQKRELKESENAIKIEKIKDGKVAATYKVIR